MSIPYQQVVPTESAIADAVIKKVAFVLQVAS